MKKEWFGMTTLLLVIMSVSAHADAISELQAEYQAQGAGSFDPEAGKALWNRRFIDTRTGKTRQCTTCHTTDLTSPGKHARTGKPIDPMALSVNPERLNKVKKIRKWFVRNCKWTLGRECTAQEKGDVLAYLKGL